jgi:hypothetical protein
MMRFAVLAALCLGVAFAATAPNENSYKWAQDWQAFSTSNEIIAMGASTNTETEVCCSDTTPQCKIEVQDEQGDVLVSVKNQATRQDVQGGRIYQFYYNPTREHPQMQYAVVQASNGSWVCQDACPIPLQESFPPLEAGFLPFNSTYKGKAVPKDISGCPSGGCDWWQIKQTILGIIVMETDDFYVYEDASQGGVPVAAISHLTPFGEPEGSSTNTWAQYQGFPNGVAASEFEFLNKATCPPPKQGCQQQQQQDHSSMYYKGLQTASILTGYRSYSQFVTNEIRQKYTNLDFAQLNKQF